MFSGNMKDLAEGKETTARFVKLIHLIEFHSTFHFFPVYNIFSDAGSISGHSFVMNN